ncbi:DEAD/DEAH box helicase [Actinosynnema sp. NPDC050436]|uniref:DEAD/DEAH box helicase n=1 Tax=Actinosynnema sp. NPDC050436 TaxID=3155659 RepID=UPI0033DC537B
MLVLHGLCSADGRPALWAEDARLPARVEGRLPKTAVRHPFAVDGATLAALLGGTTPAARVGDGSDVVAVRLPSYASGPADSPELVRDPLAKAPSRRGVVRLRSWLVPVVWLDGGLPPLRAHESRTHGSQAYESRTYESEAHGSQAYESLPDCRLGASARFLDEVVAFAHDLVSRGRVLPVIADPERRATPPVALRSAPSATPLTSSATPPAASPTTPPTAQLAPPRGTLSAAQQTGRAVVGRWRASLSGADALRHAGLRAVMPPAFRAAEGVGDALRSAVDSLVDGEVRRRLGPQSDPADRNGAASSGTASSGTVGSGAAGSGTVGSGTVDRWLGALAGEAAFDADPSDVDLLRAKVAGWAEDEIRGDRVRTCFRLSSPDQGGPADDGWRVEFLLQAVDEPSVLVPAHRVWRREDAVLRRWVDRPQEVLLGDLGRAARLYPALDRALADRRPVGMDLDVDSAHEFLTHAALLAQAGFGVLLPSWWRQPRRLGLTLTASGQGVAGTVAKESELGLKVLVDYRWDLALGDERLTEAELTSLARAKAPLVRLRGQWVHVDRKRLAEGLAFLARGGGGQMSAAQVLLHSGFGPEDADLPLPLNAVHGEGWLGDLLSGEAEHRLEPVEPPAGLTATLRPYQLRGLAWLVFLDRLGLGACLADDMGLGKTVQLLALEAHNRQRGTRPPTLLICPMSVVGNWQREAARFTPGLRVRVHHGVERSVAGLGVGHDLVITTYAVATRDAEALARVEWDRVVLDEAQNVKNSATRQSRAVRALPARHRVALTGTPVENRLAELWSIMDFVNPGVLGTVNTFRARFGVPIERHHDEDAAVRLRRITRPFVLRRLKTDPRVITDLPDKIEVKQLCTLTAEQATLYQAVLDDMFARIAEAEGVKRKGLVLATMSRLKQVCNHPAQLLGDGSRVAGRSGKLARLEEILDEALADGDKALCFTQFTEFGALVVPHLAARFDTEVLFLHGGTPKGARDEMVRRFQSADGPSIFVLSLKAGGTGLNLTSANHVIHLDRWWNPAVEDQATDRAFRIGQRNHVQVRKFVCVGTVEERVDRMIEEKRGLAQLVVGAGEDWLTGLSTGELRDLFALSGNAVGDSDPTSDDDPAGDSDPTSGSDGPSSEYGTGGPTTADHGTGGVRGE